MKRMLIEFRCTACGACFRTLERLADDTREAQTACVNCHRPLRAALPVRNADLQFPEAA